MSKPNQPNQRRLLVLANQRQSWWGRALGILVKKNIPVGHPMDFDLSVMDGGKLCWDKLGYAVGVHNSSTKLYSSQNSVVEINKIKKKRQDELLNIHTAAPQNVDGAIKVHLKKTCRFQFMIFCVMCIVCMHAVLSYQFEPVAPDLGFRLGHSSDFTQEVYLTLHSWYKSA